jgi:hypothetical protein
MHGDMRTILQYTRGLLRCAPACRELRARAYCSEFVALPYHSSPRCVSSETVLPKAQDDFQLSRFLRLPYADGPPLYAILMFVPLTYCPASVICIIRVGVRPPMGPVSCQGGIAMSVEGRIAIPPYRSAAHPKGHFSITMGCWPRTFPLRQGYRSRAGTAAPLRRLRAGPGDPLGGGRSRLHRVWTRDFFNDADGARRYRAEVGNAT